MTINEYIVVGKNKTKTFSMNFLRDFHEALFHEPNRIDFFHCHEKFVDLGRQLF